MKGKKAIMAITVISMLAAFSASAFADCCCGVPYWCKCEPREDFGRAYTLQTKGQILNPDAAANLEPVEGLSGRAAVTAVQKYVESFTIKAPLTTGSTTAGATNAK